MQLRPATRVGLSALAAGVAAVTAAAVPAAGAGPVSSKTFSMFPNPQFVSCLAKAPGTTAKATATVVRGGNNDTMTLKLTGFKPGLGFDLFTVQRSNQTSTGAPVGGFAGFGMAWYQSDIHTDSNGNANVTVKTILLDQIFGFDPDVSLPPTNTFHAGFWFDSVAEAQPCSSAPLAPTPFNGEHNAGPLAFISRPAATTNLGPLCTQPVKKGTTWVCNP